MMRRLNEYQMGRLEVVRQHNRKIAEENRRLPFSERRPFTPEPVLVMPEMPDYKGAMYTAFRVFSATLLGSRRSLEVEDMSPEEKARELKSIDTKVVASMILWAQMMVNAGLKEATT